MNSWSGVVAGIERFGSVALVDVDVDDVRSRLTATVIGIDPNNGDLNNGARVNLRFAEMDVALAKNLSGTISTRNRISCQVLEIESGQLLTRVLLSAPSSAISSTNVAASYEVRTALANFTAIITTRSSHLLGLTVGDYVEALIKANEMRLEIVE